MPKLEFAHILRGQCTQATLTSMERSTPKRHNTQSLDCYLALDLASCSSTQPYESLLLLSSEIFVFSIAHLKTSLSYSP
jgi:hypothetical protein